MTNPPLFSIILPVYKQGEHLQVLYDTYVTALEQTGDTWELLFIVNGSKDNSYEVAQRLAAQNPNIKAHNLELGGWGRAVKYGCSVAIGKYVCYTNSARTQIEDLILMLKYAKVNDRVVIKASRIVREKLSRKLGSVLYNLENRFLFKTPVMDVNGTPKIIPKEILDKLNIFSDDDLIDAEVVAKCFKYKYPVIEIPVTVTTRISGKSTTNLSSAFKMYFGLFKLIKKI